MHGRRELYTPHDLWDWDAQQPPVLVDASSGTPLWHFQANTLWKASPMTYMFDGKQHIAVASGPNIISFALVE